MKAAILARVSTVEQALKGYSIQEQLAVCRKRAEELGCRQIDEFVEEESGAFLETPVMEAFRESVKAAGYKYVITLDPDRLARNLTRQLVVANEIERAGAELVFTNYDYDKTPEGRLFFSIKGALAEYEREKIKERTYRGMRRKALSGKVPKSGRPYGYDYDSENGMYVINEEEAKIIRLIFAWIGKEKATLYETCRRLAEMAIPTKRSGGVWRTNTIAGIVHNTLYYGEAVAFKKIRKKIGPGEYKTGKHPKENWVIIQVPAIITKAEFESAQATLRENYDKAPRNTRNPYLLQGLVYCPVCGHKMGIGYNGRVTIAYFFCRTGTRADNREPKAPRCSVRMIPMHKIEEELISFLYRLSSNPDELRNYISRNEVENNESEREILTVSLDNLYKKLELLKKERERVSWLFRKGLIDEFSIETQLREIANDEKETLAYIDSVEKKSARTKSIQRQFDSFISSFIKTMEGFNEAPYYIKKAMLEEFIDKIYARRVDKAYNSDFCELKLAISFKA